MFLKFNCKQDLRLEGLKKKMFQFPVLFTRVMNLIVTGNDKHLPKLGIDPLFSRKTTFY